MRVITYWLWQFKVGILGLRVLTYKKTKVMAVQGRDIRVESNNLQKKVRSWQFKVGILGLRVITYKKVRLWQVKVGILGLRVITYRKK